MFIMNKDNDKESNKFWKFFGEISEIPRGSGNTGMISDYIAAFARDRNLRFIQEECGNVIIFKNASADRDTENTLNTAVILQAHMDMVAVMEPGVKKNMETEGIDILTADGFIKADGTTLGADDGIGVAYILAVLDDDSLSHPPIEAVFTVDEETGMYGASDLDMSVLKGTTLINLDSEDDGVIVTGCAGGAICVIGKELKYNTAEGTLISFEVSGLTGGHSGIEIDKGRGNAIKILSDILCKKRDEGLSFVITQIYGGEKDNTIPVEAGATIFVSKETDDYDKYPELFANDKYIKELSERLKKTDPGIKISCNIGPEPVKMRVTQREISDAVLDFLQLSPDGVIKYSSVFQGMPETSVNCGVAKTTDGQFEVTFLVRSNVDTFRDDLISKIKTLAGLCDMDFFTRGEYGAWEHDPDSEIRRIVYEGYEKLTGNTPVEEVIHAGLECGIFISKKSDIDCVSIGPQMYDIHTPKERLEIESAQRYMKLLTWVLEKL